MLSGVFEQTPRHIGDSRLLIREGVDNQVVHPLSPFCLIAAAAVGKCFLHNSTTAAFVLYWSRLGSSPAGGFSPITGS